MSAHLIFGLLLKLSRKSETLDAFIWHTFKVPLPAKLRYFFIAHLECVSVVQQTYQISASNSCSFLLFLQSKHASFSAAITELPIRVISELAIF